jgi:transcription antitermination factor NusG
VFTSTGSPDSEGGFCVVCGRTVQIDPTRPPGDAPCPSCGSLVWFPSAAHPGDFKVGDCVRLAYAGRFGPCGKVEVVDVANQRLRVGFYGGLQEITVDASTAAFVASRGRVLPPPPFSLPCGSCGSPAKFDPWAPPQSQTCSACHSSSAPKAWVTTPGLSAGDEVVVTAGIFFGSPAIVEAVHAVDGRVRLFIGGFTDAVVRITAIRTDVIELGGSA